MTGSVSGTLSVSSSGSISGSVSASDLFNFFNRICVVNWFSYSLLPSHIEWKRAANKTANKKRGDSGWSLMHVQNAPVKIDSGGLLVTKHCVTHTRDSLNVLSLA